MNKLTNEEVDKDIVKLQDSMPIVQEETPQGELSIISDEALLGVYGEIMGNLRDAHEQAIELSETFANLVVNDGDSSTASKEALVNLVKTRIDASDRMTKIADLMTRIKLKQPDTYKPYMGRKDDGGPTINIYDSSGMNKRALMDAIKKEKEGNH